MRKDSRKQIDRRKRVELEFLESLRKRIPHHTPTLEALGHMYTREGLYEEGLRVDLDITRLKPQEPEAWYNLACSYAMVGLKDLAFEALHKAIDLGYGDAGWMMKDPDLRSLRDDPRMIQISMRLSN